jgi:hypothetical protein
MLLTAILLVSGGWIVVVRVGNSVVIGAIVVILFCSFLASVRFPRAVRRSYGILVIAIFVASFAQDFEIDDKEFFVILKALIAGVACIYFRRTRIDFRELFVDVMYYVAIVSLVLYPLAYIAPGIARHIDDDYSTVFGLLYVRSSDLERFGHYRNQGIFWEAGVYGVMLTMAFAYNFLKYQKRPNGVFLLAALSTHSMGALSILMPFAGYCYLHRHQPKLANLGAIMVGAVIALVLAAPGAIDDTFSTLFGRSLEGDSSITVRINDMTLGARAASDSLLFGRPSGDMDAYNALALDEYGYIKVNDAGISNSITGMIYKYGVPVTILYCAVLWLRVRRDFGDMAPLVFAVFIGLLMIEPLGLSIFVFMLLANRSYPQVAGRERTGPVSPERALNV